MRKTLKIEVTITGRLAHFAGQFLAIISINEMRLLLHLINFVIFH